MVAEIRECFEYCYKEMGGDNKMKTVKKTVLKASILE